MKIAIEELLAAMDLAAAKALGQNQFNLNDAGLSIAARESYKSQPLVVSGQSLEIKPEILRSTQAAVTVKVTVRQRNQAGKAAALLSSQLLFVRMPAASYSEDGALIRTQIFSPFSAN